MKFLPLSLILASAMLVLGCANESRSRDTANPKVPASVLAAQVCSNCHGLTGNAMSPNFPNLAGQQVDYLVEQLNAFRSHGRLDPAGFEYMWGLAHGLSDEQIKGLATYFAAQSPQAQALERSSQAIAAGQVIFEAGLSDKGVPPCSSCHGQKGLGNAQFPRLAGQHADYVIKQLTVFQRTDERPEGAIMKVVAHGLSQQDIEAVAAYVQSIQP